SKNPTVADLKVNESNVVWYDAPVGGNRVDPATALVDGKTYYGATKDGDVESPTRLAITIKLKEDPKTATTANPTQEFLNSKNPTVADLKVNESNVVWYDAPVGGNRVDPATALVDGKTELQKTAM
ncbi:gliding motility-associated C-terminal domain-containing protein, partial [Flavobacterium tructae]|nr:gliding motility-associated C-terminal domain-containing protein [Flavobacterium tructae]